MTTEFKKGDIVRRKNYSHGSMRIGDTSKVTIIHESSCEVEKTGTYRHTYDNLELVKKGKFKPEDLTRFMAFGTGCNNFGSLRTTEKELKEDLKRHVVDGSWTGRIIGYKLTPILEAEQTTRLKKLTPKGRKKR